MGTVSYVKIEMAAWTSIQFSQIISSEGIQL